MYLYYPMDSEESITLPRMLLLPHVARSIPARFHVWCHVEFVYESMFRDTLTVTVI